MRYYLVSKHPDYKNEIIVDLHSFNKINDYTFECNYESSTNKKTGKILIRKLAHKYFCSLDGIKWTKLPTLNFEKELLNINHSYELFRGYKPSGIGSEEIGVLKTSMPGKIIKIFFKVGDNVKKGATLIILEAMKMENEIKSNIDGKIKNIYVSEGESIEQGKLMIEIE